MKNVCDKKMSFDDCELAILRTAVDHAEEKIGKRVVNSPEVKKMIFGNFKMVGIIQADR